MPLLCGCCDEMPCLKILTNLPNKKIPIDFVDKIIPVLSKAVNKTPEKFICAISGDCRIVAFLDSQTPAAVGTLESIGNLGREENAIISRELSTFVEKELGISPNRFFFTLYDMKPRNVAIQGTTVAEFASD